jgi:hypothetical protein
MQHEHRIRVAATLPAAAPADWHSAVIDAVRGVARDVGQIDQDIEALR